MYRAIFFDRDGVLNRAPKKGEYIKSSEEFSWCEDVFNVIRFFKSKDFLIFVITNQRGVQLNKMTENDLKKIHDDMQKQLQKINIPIDQFYYCIHGLNDNCDCRKPKPGLILKALNSYPIDPQKSLLIGDSDSDIDAGRSASLGMCYKIKKNSIKNVFNESLIKEFISE